MAGMFSCFGNQALITRQHYKLPAEGSQYGDGDSWFTQNFAFKIS